MSYNNPRESGATSAKARKAGHLSDVVAHPAVWISEQKNKQNREEKRDGK